MKKSAAGLVPIWILVQRTHRTKLGNRRNRKIAAHALTDGDINAL